MSEPTFLPDPSFRAGLLQRLTGRLDASGPDGEALRIDLHCHDKHSDMPDELWGRILRLPESWVEPRRLHKLLRKRGATAWTVTNHNNARSCWELAEQGKDVLSAAEWTCQFPEYDLAIHVLVYGFTPEQEHELESRRRDIYAFLRYCRKHDLPVIQPHPLYFYTRDRQPHLDVFEKFSLLFERFEVFNGQRDPWQNLLAWEWVSAMDPEKLNGYARKHGLDPFEFCADPWKKAISGGSDDHFGVFAGLTGTWLQVPDLAERLEAGEPPSRLALEALRAKRMGPFGRAVEQENLTGAVLDFLSQAAVEFEDPGLLRILLHKGEASDKFGCLVVANGLAELRRHAYTMRFLKAWHASLQGEKPGVMLKLTVKEDYKPFLKHLEHISKVARKRPEDLPGTLREALSDLFSGMMKLTLHRARKGLGPIAARWAAEEGGRPLRLDDWIAHLEVPSHFRAILGNERPKEPRSMSAVQVSAVLDDLTFPSLMTTMLAGASGIAAHHLHGGRELMNRLAAGIGGTGHPRRVLWLTDTFFDGNGVSSALQSVLAEVRRRDLPVDFLICHGEQTSETHLRVVRPLESFTLPGFGDQPIRIPDLLEVLRLVEAEGYDRLIVSTEGVMGWVGLFLKHALRLPAHFFMHTDWLEFLVHNSELDQQGLDRARRLLRWFYRQWEGLFVLNRQHVEWLAGPAMEIPRDRLHLTAHWAAPEYVPEAGEDPALPPEIDPDRPILLYVGRLSEEKGVLEVVDAWRLIQREIPTAQLVIAGRGPAEGKLRGLAPEAYFPGWVDRATLAGWFRASSLLLFPSRFDTFGCAVLEALSCGLPVACYPVKGPADLIQEGVNGLVCEDAMDMGQRASAYMKLPPAEREAFRNRALATAGSYRADQILDEMMRVVGLGRAI
ncbi:glycosyltransferase [Geothrix sp. 21YS21S-2]|uniref:glycosyltransferase n=1 Tax=Geothrix sp. 21YS21S-2 TaxID=3068893 RepID=UPI0027BAD6B6|nr:glycosyltransferase [Geothrix sp. 21YS21S-2]